MYIMLKGGAKKWWKSTAAENSRFIKSLTKTFLALILKLAD